MKNKVLCSALLMSALLGGTSAADEKEMTKAEKRLAQIEKKYQPTGQTRACVPLRSLRESRVIDDQTIFFKGPGKRAYINRLPRRCSRLAFENRFSYTTTIGQLCKSEIITVLDNMGSAWGSCGLGQFEEWEKKPKTEKSQSD